MADRTITTNEDALTAAIDAQALLAMSKLRLWDGVVPVDVTTPVATLIAAETALIGYPVGGYTITAMTGPSAIPGVGVGIQTPAIPVLYASGAAVSIGGAWIETAAGDPYKTYIFDPPIPLAAVPDGFTFIREIVFPSG